MEASNSTDMDFLALEQIRRKARDALQNRNSASVALPETQLATFAVPTEIDCLWQDLSSQNASSNIETCESLLVAQSYFRARKPDALSESDETVVNDIYAWASSLALPSSAFAVTLDAPSDDQKQAIQDDQLRSNLALSVISAVPVLLPIHKARHISSILLALASFTSEADPWTTSETYALSTTLIHDLAEQIPARELWVFIEDLLKKRIRPLFIKTRNPAITQAGRKDFHPIPLARFDASVLDPETKPWKVSDVYATTVLSWIIKHYQSKSKEFLDAQFPLLVPPILALIDDDNSDFKTRGCTMFSQILLPIRESHSDVLQRTNLSSVFEDAIRPCLLSLPTITPEDEAISLLGAAYPALLSLFKINSLHPSQRSSQQATSQPTPKEAYMSSLTKTLRENLIPSFHHVSSTNTTSAAAIPSYPYPRLSTLLLQHTSTVLQELGIYTTKYLQDIVPILHATLSNPFGPAYPPLLFSSLAVTRAVVLNAHPRLWRWRGELLGALCSCFLHVDEEEQEIGRREQTDKPGGGGSDEDSRSQMRQVKRELQGAIYLLKLALENPVQGEGDEGQLEAKENIGKELNELVEADGNLRDLLLADVGGSDAAFFGLES